jgi:branched-chain amino acid transport system substrate-binding protein
VRSARRPIALTGILCLSLSLAACGTRRSDKDFTGASNTLQQNAGAGTTGDAAGTTGGAGGGSTGGSSTGAVVGPTSGTTGGTTGGTSGATGGSTGGTTGGATGGTTGGATGGTAGGSTGGGGGGGASDVGVTATSINLGNVVTKSGGFGPDQFTPFYYGAAAYFDALNARGGINGRKVSFQTCDDQGTASANTNCVRKFVDDTKVFAFVSNNCLVCDGLKYASDKAVPSVGGLAIDFRDYALPHFWRYSGNPYPQNGSIGYKGKLYQGTQQYRYFKVKYGVKKAGVVYYDNSAASKTAGLSIIQALKSEGIEATAYPQNVALPQYDSAVIDMKQKGISAVWDSIDISGNQNLCKSIDSNGLVLKAKVSTIAVWSQAVGSQFSSPCRSYIFSVEDPGTLTYDQTSNAEIAKFRAASKRYFPNRESKLYQWSVDGWASAMWFTDAATSCGAALTRKCLEAFLNRPKGYTANGIWWPRNNEKYDFERQKTLYRCIQVDQWDDKQKTFVVRAPFQSTCYTTPYLAYDAPV